MCVSINSYVEARRVSDPIELHYRQLSAAQHGCWEYNSGPLCSTMLSEPLSRLSNLKITIFQETWT